MSGLSLVLRYTSPDLSLIHNHITVIPQSRIITIIFTIVCVRNLEEPYIILQSGMHFKNLPPTSFNNDSSSFQMPYNYRRSAYIFSSSYFTYCQTSWFILSFSIYCCCSFYLSCSLYLNKELYFVEFSRDFRNLSTSQSILAVSIRSPSIPFYSYRLRNSKPAQNINQ